MAPRVHLPIGYGRECRFIGPAPHRATPALTHKKKSKPQTGKKDGAKRARRGGGSNDNKKKGKGEKKDAKGKGNDKNWRPEGLCYNWARKQTNSDKDGCKKSSKECSYRHSFKNDKERKWARDKWE